jgi:hypothetical protein
MANDCGICCNTFNLKGRKDIGCGYCDYHACSSCIQTYLLNTTIDAHCMNCRKGWNQEFLDAALTKSFMTKDFKKHRENLLFEREKCLLPATQEVLLRDKRIIQLENEQTKLFDELHDIHVSLNIYDAARSVKIRARIDVIRRTLAELRGEGPVSSTSVALTRYLRKCPVDNCKGFLTDEWHCGICEKDICENCNEIKSTDHVCDPNNVATTELLKKDSKGCPSCGQFIFRISGCPQMWCPGCHVAFNWNTLQIETGHIHNPHFYEFRRNNMTVQNRDPGDIPCGGMPRIDHIAYIFGRTHVPVYVRETGSNFQMFLNIHRITTHMRDIHVNRVLLENTNEDLRLRYLTNYIDESTFKKNLIQREKARKKALEYREIYTTFVNISEDLLRQLVIDFTKLPEIKRTFENLREFTNSALLKVRARYNSKAAIDTITSMWDIEDS